MNDHKPKSLDHIAPRIDGDGVGWCDAGCPQYTDPMTRGPAKPACAIDMPGAANRWPMDEVCPVHARSVAQWAEWAYNWLRWEVDTDDTAEVLAATCDGEQLILDYPGKQGGA